MSSNKVFVTKKDTEFKSAQIEINSRHLEISFTLAIFNSTVPTLAVIMLIICIDSLSLLATSGTAARLFTQTADSRTLWRLCEGANCALLGSAECLTGNLRTYSLGQGKQSKA